MVLQAGLHSRFNVDPRIPRQRFIDLYKLWLKNSISREIAEEVRILRFGGSIVGIVTLGQKIDRADIGLIAVDSSMRRKGFGGSLVYAAQEWALKKEVRLGSGCHSGR